MNEAARRVGVDIKVGAILDVNLLGINWLKYVAEHQAEWNGVILDGLGSAADFFIIHVYAPFDSGKLPESAMRRLILASPERVGHNLAWIKAELKRRGLKAPLWVTEFNYMSSDYATSWKYGEDPIQGALVASLLIEFARHGVEGACYWSLIGNHNFGMVKTAEHRQMRPAGFCIYTLRPCGEPGCCGPIMTRGRMIQMTSRWSSRSAASTGSLMIGMGCWIWPRTIPGGGTMKK